MQSFGSPGWALDPRAISTCHRGIACITGAKVVSKALENRRERDGEVDSTRCYSKLGSQLIELYNLPAAGEVGTWIGFTPSVAYTREALWGCRVYRRKVQPLHFRAVGAVVVKNVD